jgi:micrococcal nuclease
MEIDILLFFCFIVVVLVLTRTIAKLFGGKIKPPVISNKTWDDHRETIKKVEQKFVAPTDLVKRHFKAKVQRVIDGDTVIIDQKGKKIKIRLDSIDCPEDGQPWGNTATAGLVKMIGGQNVEFEVFGTDKYGRTLATIYATCKKTGRQINVNEQMVMKGHAWVMPQFYDHLPQERKNQMHTLENWAKSKNVGLWGTENPTAPWLWRNNKLN